MSQRAEVAVGNVLIKHIMTTLATWHMEFPENPNKSDSTSSTIVDKQKPLPCAVSTLHNFHKEGREGGKQLLVGVEAHRRTTHCWNDDVT